MTQGELYRTGRRILRECGIDTDAFDAMSLLTAVLGISRQQLLVHGDTPVPLPQSERYLGLIRQRGEHTPLQYLLGRWEFLDMTLQVGQGVLIPREETELLCRLAAEKLEKGGVGLDLCAGTGAVGLGLQRLCPQKRIWAVEKYAPAFSYLEANIRQWAPGTVQPVRGDVLTGECSSPLPESVDFLLSNPPYVAKGEYDSLQAEVKREPDTALLGGETGLDFYRAIAAFWVPRLRACGLLAVEIGEEQAPAVTEIFRRAGIGELTVHRDFMDLDRVVMGVKNRT